MSKSNGVDHAGKNGHADVLPATGKLGILIPGLGAVATTLIAGVSAVRNGFSQPIGSLTQMGHIRLGKRTEKREPKIKDFDCLLTDPERHRVWRMGPAI